MTQILVRELENLQTRLTQAEQVRSIGRQGQVPLGYEKNLVQVTTQLENLKHMRAASQTRRENSRRDQEKQS